MKIRVSVGTDRVGSQVTDEIDIPEAELEGLSKQAREDKVGEIAWEWAMNYIDFDWRPLE